MAVGVTRELTLEKGVVELGNGSNAMSVRWAMAGQPLPGETRSGDLHIVRNFDGGFLIGAVDGLGHGRDAALAAETAIRTLSHDPGDTVISIVNRVHNDLRTTRGVVMSLASFRIHDRLLTWVSVGNVEGMLIRANPSIEPSREMIVMRGGVVGYQLPQLYASILQIGPGDLLVFATDGIRNFSEAIASSIPAPLDELTQKICREYSKGIDDSLVIAARFDERRNE